MLKIDAIPNYNNNPAFKARFIGNEPLEVALKNASEYELLQFSKLLKNMKRFDDGKTYKIYKRTGTYGDWLVGRKEGISLELWTDDKANKSGSTFDLCDCQSPESAYKGILYKVTKYLLPRYPEPEVTKVKRETSMRWINKELVHEV